MPYLLFILFIAGVGSLIWSGLSFHEDGITFEVISCFIMSLFFFGLATIGTIIIIWE